MNKYLIYLKKYFRVKIKIYILHSKMKKKMKFQIIFTPILNASLLRDHYQNIIKTYNNSINHLTSLLAAINLKTNHLPFQ